MSEPKRYERCYHKDYIPEGMEEHYNGKWVSYADYARLKALIIEMDKTINESQAGVRYLQSEVERLKNNCEYLDQKLDEEIDKSAMLCGQVELLTKYGDVLESGLRTLPGDFPRCLANEWTAAKQGKQS